jgi:hypothetical protein
LLTNRRVILLVGVIGATVVALKFFPLPFAWIGLLWSVAAFSVVPGLRAWARQPVLMLGSVALALGLAEIWFSFTLPPEVERISEPSLNRPDDVLGWSPKASQIVHVTESAAGQQIYDVRYSIDANGHRVVAPDRGEKVEGCVFFFADSFTFGEGVNDQESLPYQFGLITQGHFAVVNFASPGYGAEHMLASVERGELSGTPPCVPTHIVYLALPHHALRAAGKTSFSGSGPRYRLLADGSVEYIGTPGKASAPAPGWFAEKWEYQLTKSEIVRALERRPTIATDADLDLYCAIVRQAYRIFGERWPRAARYIVSWDIHDYIVSGQERFHRGLATVDARVYDIDSIIPGYSQDPEPHSIHHLELHPSAQTYYLVAAYLAAEVTRNPGTPAESRATGLDAERPE